MHMNLNGWIQLVRLFTLHFSYVTLMMYNISKILLKATFNGIISFIVSI